MLNKKKDFIILLASLLSTSQIFASTDCQEIQSEKLQWFKELSKNSDIRLKLMEESQIENEEQAKKMKWVDFFKNHLMFNCEVKNSTQLEKELNQLVADGIKNRKALLLDVIEKYKDSFFPRNEMEEYLELAKEDNSNKDANIKKFEQSLENSEAATEKRKQSCTYKNNLKPPLSKKDAEGNIEPIPRDQPKGWCYAYTAADMISFKKRVEVSAIDLATLYNLKVGKTSLLYSTGGQIEEAIKSSDKVCLEKDLPTTDIQRIEKILSPEFLTKFNDLKNEYNGSWFFNAGEKNVLSENDCLEFKKILPRKTVSEILDILKKWNEKELVREYLTQNCAKKINISDIAVSTTDYRGNSKNLLNDFDKELNKGNILGIAYDANYLYDPDAVSDDKKNHASSIVGRRYNEETDTCEYLVRNSYGKACDDYQIPPFTCDNGHVWVSENIVTRMTYWATYFK